MNGAVRVLALEEAVRSVFSAKLSDLRDSAVKLSSIKYHRSDAECAETRREDFVTGHLIVLIASIEN